MSQFLRKLTDRRKDEGNDGQTLFYRTLPAEAGGPTRDRVWDSLKLMNPKVGHRPLLGPVLPPDLVPEKYHGRAT